MNGLMQTVATDRLVREFNARPYTWNNSALFFAVQRILPDDAIVDQQIKWVTQQLVEAMLARFEQFPPLVELANYLSTSFYFEAFLRQLAANDYQFIEIECFQYLVPELENENALVRFLNIHSHDFEFFCARLQGHINSQFNHYTYAVIPKRNGQRRLIEQPKPLLKSLQKKILEGMLNKARVHCRAYGFVKHRSCSDHAAQHVGKKYIMSFDLADYFQSIAWTKVKALFQQLGYSQPVASALSAICTVAVDKTIIGKYKLSQGNMLQIRHLPQGAPTSPALANLISYELDVCLSKLALIHGCSYSRYADDLAFSTNTPIDWQRLAKDVAVTVKRCAFRLNKNKTRLKSENQKQRLTGIVVNEKVNVDRQYYDNLKATLHNCLKFGVASQNHSRHPNFLQSLQGKVAYVKSLNPAKAVKLEAMLLKLMR